MSIYYNTNVETKQSVFTPTWLYIKQHNTTGLKYFEKTISKNPQKYRGSGTYWKNHLKKHGNDVSTIWYQLFLDQDSLTKYSLKFSIDNSIVESNDWANLKPENGLDGNPCGIVLSEDHKRKIGASNKGKNKNRVAPNKGIPHTNSTKEKMSIWQKGIPKSESSCQKMSNAKKGKPKTKVCRIHDKKVMDISNFIGWVRKQTPPPINL